MPRDPVRTRALITTGLVLGAVLAPGLQHLLPAQRDSFPLSYFPMFSNTRPEVEEAVYVLGLGPEERKLVSYRTWSTGGWTAGWRQLQRTVRAGPEAATALCEQVAARFARDDDGWGRQVHTIAITWGTFTLHEYFAEGREEPREERTLVTCRVQGRTP